MEFVTERFEDTAVCRFILAARAFIAEVEQEKIVERTTRGKAERARSGRIPQATGRGLYGYHYDRASGHRVVNDEQAFVVRRIFEDFAAGGSIVGITNALNEEATPTYTGGMWSTWTIRNMLLNPAYAGRTIYRRTRARHRRDPSTARRRRVVEVRDQSEWIEIPDATPAIVPEAVFEAVQVRLLDPERRRRSQRKYDYPLGGVVRCAHCHSAMVGQMSMGKYRYYRCRRSFAGPRHDRCPTRYVRAGPLEDAVVQEVTTVLASPDVVLAELEHGSARDDADRDLVTARELLASLDKQRQRLLRLFQLGEVDEAYLQKEVAAIQARRSPAEASIARLKGASHAAQIPRNTEEFAATCEALRERVVTEVEADHLNKVAEAMQLAVEIQRTDDGTSGLLKGVIPHDLDSFGGKISHHCTNIGMTTRSCENRCAPFYVVLSF